MPLEKLSDRAWELARELARSPTCCCATARVVLTQPLRDGVNETVDLPASVSRRSRACSRTRARRYDPLRLKAEPDERRIVVMETELSPATHRGRRPDRCSRPPHAPVTASAHRPRRAAVISSRVAVALGYERVSVTLLGESEPTPELPSVIWAQVVEAGETGVPTLIRDLHERPEPELAGLAATGSWRSAAFVPVSARGAPDRHAQRARAPSPATTRLPSWTACRRPLASPASRSTSRSWPGGSPKAADSGDDCGPRANSRRRRAPSPVSPSSRAEMRSTRSRERLAQSLGTSVLVWDVPGAKIRAFAGEPEFRSRVTDLLAARIRRASAAPPRGERPPVPRSLIRSVVTEHSGLPRARP